MEGRRSQVSPHGGSHQPCHCSDSVSIMPRQLCRPVLLCAYFQVNFMGRDFNAFSYWYFKTGSSLRDPCLAVMLRRFDEGSMLSTGTSMNDPEYQFRSDVYMAYLNEHIQEYRFSSEHFKSSMRALMSLDLSASIGVVQPTTLCGLCPFQTSMSTRGRFARARALQSSTSTHSGILQVKNACAGCQVLLRHS